MGDAHFQRFDSRKQVSCHRCEEIPSMESAGRVRQEKLIVLEMDDLVFRVCFQDCLKDSVVRANKKMSARRDQYRPSFASDSGVHHGHVDGSLPENSCMRP